jgi:hypothetical protein
METSMDQAAINIWAVLAAVVAKQVIGFLWYSPFLFGHKFAEASGQTEAEIQPRMIKAIRGDVAGAAVTALVLAYVISSAGVIGPFFGALVGLMCWAGFTVPAAAAPVLFERRPVKLLALQSGYMALALAAMGAILGGWQ